MARILAKALPLDGPIESADALHDYFCGIIHRECEDGNRLPFLVQAYVIHDLCRNFMMGPHQNQVCTGKSVHLVSWSTEDVGLMRAELYVVYVRDEVSSLEKG